VSNEEPEEESPRPAKAGDHGDSDPAEEESAEEEVAASAEVVERPTKKKRAAERGEARRPRRAVRRSSPRDAEGAPDRPAPRDDVPAFALNFPSDPELDELVAAFEQGNYARVRKEAPELAKRTDRPEVRKAARELARRLDPDPIAVYLLAAAAALLAFLAVWFWAHPHELP
jgi:hypothetical protein